MSNFLNIESLFDFYDYKDYKKAKSLQSIKAKYFKVLGEYENKQP